MEAFSALLAICAGNSPVPGEFPAQRPVAQSFDVFFDLRLNKRLSKQSWSWWFETQSRPLWRHCSVSWNDLFNGCRIVFIIGAMINVTDIIEFFFMEVDDLSVLHCQYRCCWWSGDSGSQVVSSKDFGIVLREYMNQSTRKVEATDMSRRVHTCNYELV